MKINRLELDKSTAELKKLIAEHPDYPIVVLAGECASDGYHSWTYCSNIGFKVEKMLDAEYYDYDDTVITDRDRLEEVVGDNLYENYHDKPEAEYEQAIKDKLAELEPYWKDVIMIYADN